MKKIRHSLLGLVLGSTAMLLTACEPSTTTVSGGVYYDSMLWNDYYYGYPRPPRPERPPVKPENPIERPPVARPPVARPPVARPPIHRPPVARPMPARL